jgi:hypothetical protein
MVCSCSCSIGPQEIVSAGHTRHGVEQEQEHEHEQEQDRKRSLFCDGLVEALPVASPKGNGSGPV